MKKIININGELFESTILASKKTLEDSMLNQNRRIGNSAGKRNLYIDRGLTKNLQNYFPDVLDDFNKQNNKSPKKVKVYFNIVDFLNFNEIVNTKKTEKSEPTKSNDLLLNELKKISNNKSHFYIDATLSNAGYHGVSLKMWKKNKEYLYDVLFIDTLFNLYIFKNNNENSIFCEFFQTLKLDNKVNVTDEKLNKNSIQKIYFGAPGTGKSHQADIDTKGKNVKKTTFHPEYDYTFFVGSYKPSMDNGSIIYEFAPQIFTKIYVEAWKNYASENVEDYYLQIEEINRGNCAEIFGDLFQLLDRDENGFSKYEITADDDLLNFLISENGFNSDEHEGIKNGRLKLPPNFNIIATMNTSDQSLFPMDSAFKRRWDWQYIPINTDCEHSNFTIELDNGNQYKWLDFLKSINAEIFDITKSQDKQIGNWFVNAMHTNNTISQNTFINKVIFYLWNDVFKDEESSIFKLDEENDLNYNSFFETKNVSNLLSNIFEKRLSLIKINNEDTSSSSEE